MFKVLYSHSEAVLLCWFLFSCSLAFKADFHHLQTGQGRCQVLEFRSSHFYWGTQSSSDYKKFKIQRTDEIKWRQSTAHRLSGLMGITPAMSSNLTSIAYLFNTFLSIGKRWYQSLVFMTNSVFTKITWLIELALHCTYAS